MFVLSTGFAALTLVLSWLLSPRRPDPVKDAPYECGVDPIGDARMRHSVRFYVVAMLFIIFDLETVFLYPWAVTYRKLGLFGLMEMVVFLLILMVGYVYVWRRGALNWSEQAEADAQSLVDDSRFRPTPEGYPSQGIYEWSERYEPRR